MNNSNQTLRFPRSYREATGQDAHFEKRDPDRIVFVLCMVMAVFVAGMMVGGIL